MKRNILFTLLVLCLNSCYKDKGNYDLKDVNSIEIKDMATNSFTVNQYDNLKISYDLSQTQAAPADMLEYNWSMYLNANGVKNVLFLSAERNLDAQVVGNPGSYILLYKVTDKRTGVTFFKEEKLTVTSKLNEGWLVLGAEKAGMDLTLINPQGDVMGGLFSSYNQGKALPQDAHALTVLRQGNNTTQNIFVLAGTELLQLENSSFLKSAEAKDLFFTLPTTEKPQHYYYSNVGNAAFLINNGQVHTYATSNGLPYKLSPAIEGNYRIAPYGFPLSGNDTFLYDELNQRFIRLTNYVISYFSNPSNAAFDMNNVGKQLVYAGKSVGNLYNCIMKDNQADNFYVYRVNTTGSLLASAVHPILNAPGLKSASMFASSGLYLHIYYIADNAVYLLDIVSGKSRLLYRFESGEEVSAMALKQSNNLLISYTDNNRVLAVSTVQNGKGKFYIFNISNTGDFDKNTYTKRYENLGLIKYITYKPKL